MHCVWHSCMYNALQDKTADLCVASADQRKRALELYLVAAQLRACIHGHGPLSSVYMYVWTCMVFCLYVCFFLTNIHVCLLARDPVMAHVFYINTYMYIHQST